MAKASKLGRVPGDLKAAKDAVKPITDAKKDPDAAGKKEVPTDDFQISPDGQRIFQKTDPLAKGGPTGVKLNIPLQKVDPQESTADFTKRINDLKIVRTVDDSRFIKAVKSINPAAVLPLSKMPEDVRASMLAINQHVKRFHGAKINLSWFPGPAFRSPCADKFGYLTSATVRASSKLDFNIVNVALMRELGTVMAAAGREAGIGDSNIPAGYTYFGQFADHDFTLDVSSTIEAAQDATTINNMRTPSLDLDCVYGRGPALSP